MSSYVKIKLQAGRGGDGIISWARNRYNSRMGPNGGNGGNGGSIYLVVNKKINDFSSINRYLWKAENGFPGQRDSKFGLKGRDISIDIPENTEVYDFGEKIKRTTVTSDSPTYLVCRGGKGGRGNKSFKSARYQSPQLYELGEKGEQRKILLILSKFKRIGIINLLDSENKAQNNWENLREELCSQLSGIEFFDFPSEIFSKNINDFYSSHLELCRLFICVIHFDFLKGLQNLLLSIESKLKERGFSKLLKIIYFDNEESLESSDDCIYINNLGDSDFSKVSSKLNWELSQFQGLPCFKSSQVIDEEGFIEYSDEILPEKEELKILKNENVWEIQSSRLSYWTSRIPQTTWHNLERLREKLKIEEIMKILKKQGGIEGEVIRIYNFETTIY
ncbi:GTP-binding protein Obg/CgtA [Mycoplasma suis KI3806]|uniref:GTP-binding protein Obg/CgtA n=1 Tax=Mycoplasma suis (strain KI_3806) TaxID=708248 RepID=F0V3H9_MYCS3|nr:Obg family GTPase CgtA [Mycoplasma suis]CBZ40401.1 GTP-binding protein Obg/CgtA [Mycoplasma suis KI3806]